jgi:SsrA-binding protein
MRIISKNKKAYFTYNIFEKLEAGISLIGQEVKSIKAGRINLAGSYAVLKKGEVFLIGANVPPYQPKNAPKDYNPERSRKLLLKKSEIRYLIGKTQQKGLTIVPLMIYTKAGKIKVELGIVKGKSKPDKRATIKKREADRQLERTKREFNM